jgi:hypothetical protein
MRQTLHVCFLAGMLMLATVKAAGAPIAGVWEGTVKGRKAVTLRIEDDGALHGTAVFYITEDNRDGSHNGDALPPLVVENPKWDGAAVHFTLAIESRTVPFVMKITTDGRAELHYRLNDRGAETVIPLTAIR